LPLSELSSTQAPLQVVPPAGHEQVPPEQVCPAAHAVPQPPQLPGLVAVSTHAPVAAQ
jgi:hypothetical protein